MPAPTGATLPSCVPHCPVSYAEQVKLLKYFGDQIETRAGAGVAASLRYRTACKLYNLPVPYDPQAVSASPKKKSDRGDKMRGLMKKDKSKAMVIASNFTSMMSYGGGGSSMTNMAAFCPPSRTDKVWDTIDCHLHLLDFLQKSSGTSAALKAMDGCACKKALVFGMPCCK